MRVINNNFSIDSFNAWSGAKDTKETIINEGKVNEFNSLIEELYPEGIEEGHLNDLLWFEDLYIYEMLGINQDEEE